VTGTPLPLASYAIRIHERRVRAVPLRDVDGTPFAGPAVDLPRADATAAIDAARPVLAWLDAREPGVRVRSILVRTAAPRVVVSLDPGATDPRPRVIRFDPANASELRDAACDAEQAIGRACAGALARRRVSPRA
jgi:hypothetical protein